MVRNRRTRLITVCLALVSLLFMQLAVASYACPGAQSSRVAEVAAMAEAGMPCAETMSLPWTTSNPICAKPIAKPASRLRTSTSYLRWHPPPWRT